MLYAFSLPTKADKAPAGPDWVFARILGSAILRTTGEDAIAAAGFVLVVLTIVATVAVLLVTFLV